VFHKIVELREAERGEVALAGIDLLVERRPTLEADIDLVPARLLEAGGKLAHPGLGRLIKQHSDLGGVCWRRQPDRAQEPEREKAYAYRHDILPMVILAFAKPTLSSRTARSAEPGPNSPRIVLERWVPALASLGRDDKDHFFSA